MNWVAVVSFLNKLFPWLVTIAAYLKGKSDAKREVNEANLEKEKEYAQIDADKPDDVSDDLDRMRQGTF